MSANKTLKQTVHDLRIGHVQRNLAIQQVASNLLIASPYLNDPDFRRIHPDDLRLLFELYDEHFFDGALQSSLPPSPISFRLSRRMTRAGGKTTRFLNRRAGAIPRYEIAVSTTLLFESFRNPERGITVTGLECTSRLEALMRIMEHELVHLTEMILWEQSSCARERFQGIASRLFGHTDHRHDLTTPTETAATEFGIRTGSRVRFDYDGHSYEGFVNRITKRATVLVEHPDGQRFSDGHRYVKFYIPVRDLEAVER